MKNRLRKGQKAKVFIRRVTFFPFFFMALPIIWIIFDDSLLEIMQNFFDITDVNIIK